MERWSGSLRKWPVSYVPRAEERGPGASGFPGGSWLSGSDAPGAPGAPSALCPALHVAAYITPGSSGLASGRCESWMPACP